MHFNIWNKKLEGAYNRGGGGGGGLISGSLRYRLLPALFYCSQSKYDVTYLLCLLIVVVK